MCVNVADPEHGRGDDRRMFRGPIPPLPDALERDIRVAEPETVSAALRERVYAALTSLSAVMILFGFADVTSPASAATSIAVTLGGLFAAALVADIVAHSAVHGSPPRGREMRRIGVIAGQALEIGFIPIVVVLLSVTGIWTVRTGLILAMISLVLTILVIAIWAVHRSTLTALQRFLVVAAELSLCLVVVAIKLLAH